MEDSERPQKEKKAHKGSKITAYVLLVMSLLIYFFGTKLMLNNLNNTIAAESAAEAIGGVIGFLIAIIFTLILYIISLILSIVSTAIISQVKKHKFEIIFPVIGILLPIITFAIVLIRNYIGV